MKKIASELNLNFLRTLNFKFEKKYKMIEEKENVVFQKNEKMNKNLDCYSRKPMSFLSEIAKSQINEEKQSQKIKKCPSLMEPNKLPKEMIIKTLNLVNSLNEIYIITLKKTFKQIKNFCKTSQKSFMLMFPILKRICGLKHFYETNLMRSSFAFLKSLYLVDICTKNKNFEKKNLAMTKLVCVFQNKQNILEKNVLNKFKKMKNIDFVNQIQKFSFLLLGKIAKNLSQNLLKFFFSQMKNKMPIADFVEKKSKKFQEHMKYIISSKKYSIFHKIRLISLKKEIEEQKHKQIMLLITKLIRLEKKKTFEKLKNYSACFSQKSVNLEEIVQKQKKCFEMTKLFKRLLDNQKKEFFNKIRESQHKILSKKYLIMEKELKKGVSLDRNLEKCQQKRNKEIFG